MLISNNRSFPTDKPAIDGQAQRIVLDAYRDGCQGRSPDPFDAALAKYQLWYPYISREQAGHVVAHILSTAGM